MKRLTNEQLRERMPYSDPDDVTTDGGLVDLVWRAGHLIRVCGPVDILLDVLPRYRSEHPLAWPDVTDVRPTQFHPDDPRPNVPTLPFRFEHDDPIPAEVRLFLTEDFPIFNFYTAESARDALNAAVLKVVMAGG